MYVKCFLAFSVVPHLRAHDFLKHFYMWFGNFTFLCNLSTSRKEHGVLQVFDPQLSCGFMPLLTLARDKRKPAVFLLKIKVITVVIQDITMITAEERLCNVFLLGTVCQIYELSERVFHFMPICDFLCRRF